MKALTVVMAIKGLAGVGAVGLAVWLLAVFGEKIPSFQVLEPMYKRVIMFLLSAIIALSAYLALVYIPDSVWVAIEQPFIILGTIFVAIFGNQLAHQVSNKLRHNSKVIAQIEARGMLVPDGLLTPSMTAPTLPPGKGD